MHYFCELQHDFLATVTVVVQQVPHASPQQSEQTGPQQSEQTGPQQSEQFSPQHGQFVQHD